MATRTRAEDVQAAASAASEAARTLAARSHEVRAEKAEEPVPTEPPNYEQLLKNRPSEQAREDIIRKRGLNEDDTVPLPAPVEAKVEPKAESVAETPVEPVVEPEAPKTVKVKVDGEEFEVPQSEIDEAGSVTAYQKQRAADNRLAKATKLAEEARQSQTQTAQLVELLLKQQPPAKPEVTDDQFIAEKIDIIRFGSPQESAAALREVMKRGMGSQPNPQQIVDLATNKINNQNAVAEFKRKNSDIVSNPTLLTLAQAIERREMEKLPKGQIVDWSNFYSKIENEIRAVAPARQSQSPATPKTEGNTSQPSEKEARKASIVNLPSAAARAAAPAEEKELTSEEMRLQFLADAKKARRQG